MHRENEDFEVMFFLTPPKHDISYSAVLFGRYSPLVPFSSPVILNSQSYFPAMNWITDTQAQL